jgi:hypothetical protein
MGSLINKLNREKNCGIFQKTKTSNAGGTILSFNSYRSEVGRAFYTRLPLFMRILQFADLRQS